MHLAGGDGAGRTPTPSETDTMVTVAQTRNVPGKSPSSTSWCLTRRNAPGIPTGSGRGTLAGIESGFVPGKRLRLAHSVRSHLSNVLHEHVDALPGFENRTRCWSCRGRSLPASSVSRDLGKCETHLRERHGGHSVARHGKMVSVRARNMGRHGFPDEWEAIGAVKNKVGHCYGNDETEAIACRR